MRLNQLMRRTLLRVFLVTLPLAVLAVWAGQTASTAALKRTVMESSREQLRRALVKISDRKMLDRAWKAAGMMPSDGSLTDEQMERMLRRAEADAIHICDTNGVIVRTSVPEYLGLDFRKHRQTLPFCALLGERKELAQEFGPIAYDMHRYRKFVGVALRGGGLLQLEFNEDRYLIEPDLERVRIVPVIVITGTVVFLFLVIAVCVYLFFRKRIIAPIRRANESLARIASGDLNEKVLAGGSTEMEALADDINVTVDRLRGYIAEAEQRAAAEMAMAKAIQYNVLPSTFPPYPDLGDKIDIFAQMITAKEVGGDFYDFYFAGKNRLALVVADVSGKGIPAALFMMRAKATLQSYLKSGFGVVEAVKKTNHRLATRNDANMFVTAWIGIVDLTNGKVEYVNAGHNPPIVRHVNGSFTYLRDKHGPPLAAMDGVSYRNGLVDLSLGEGIFLYTDGVTEATNPALELYGEDRLVSAFRSATEVRSSKRLCEDLLADVDRFASGAEQADDITMLAFKLNGIQRTFDASQEGILEAQSLLEEFGDNPKAAVIQDEIISNIVRCSGTHTFTVKLIRNGNDLTMVFIDSGKAFDPLADAPEPDVKASADKRGIGGLGIYMVKKMSKAVSYARVENQNVLTVTVAM